MFWKKKEKPEEVDAAVAHCIARLTGDLEAAVADIELWRDGHKDGHRDYTKVNFSLGKFDLFREWHGARVGGGVIYHGYSTFEISELDLDGCGLKESKRIAKKLHYWLWQNLWDRELKKPVWDDELYVRKEKI